ncbi:Putative transposable element [Caligus rogercresseyi]|uniref:Transposable element n=1 Tax=Caligus rogercresseyi TaxID=217165 RepID=A0A7T8GS50_CALRO|nr:Putative transposable element [Caligus rogercresseyi]
MSLERYTWTLDPVRNRRNDRYLSFRDVDENHPARVMSLGFAASNGKAMDLFWILTGYRAYLGRLNRDPEDQNVPSGNVVLQQDGAPAHTEMDFWARLPTPWTTLLAHIESKACKLRPPKIDALNQEWAGIYEDFVSGLQGFQKRLMAIVAVNGGPHPIKRFKYTYVLHTVK